MWCSDSKQNKEEFTKPNLKGFGLEIETCAVTCNNINVEVFVLSHASKNYLIIRQKGTLLRNGPQLYK